jgi:hypothetical protein
MNEYYLITHAIDPEEAGVRDGLGTAFVELSIDIKKQIANRLVTQKHDYVDVVNDVYQISDKNYKFKRGAKPTDVIEFIAIDAGFTYAFSERLYSSLTEKCLLEANNTKRIEVKSANQSYPYYAYRHKYIPLSAIVYSESLFCRPVAGGAEYFKYQL